MNESVFERRDRFLAEFKRVFTDAGRQFRKYKGEPSYLVTFEIEPTRLSFVYDIHMVDQITRAPQLNFGAGVGLPEFTSIEDKIFARMNEDSSETILASLCVQDTLPKSTEQYRDFLKALSERLIVWGKQQDVIPRIKEYAEPWRTDWQLPHLAALAYVGDFNTLMDYQEMFERGKRANFYPMIKPEMIDRAVDIALERA